MNSTATQTEAPTPFRNEPLTDFTVAANRERFRAALARIAARIAEGPYRAAPIIDGKELTQGERYERVDPADNDIVVGTTTFCTAADAQRAVQVLLSGQPAWDDFGYEKRAACIARAGDLMADERFDLAALIIREAGKSWREADADVAEAIDFCRYYAAEMRRLGPPLRTAEVPGEDNIYSYKPRGIAAVIAPWNFPLAIACGMAVAALVTGNAVALKPAEQTGIIAHRLVRILLEAGVPTDVLAFLPGWGEAVGRALVDHPRVDLICFTGSKAVGLEIIAKAAQTKPEQTSIKRVIAELGGKNCIIVDEDADLDEAIKAITYSAFGFSGQKCSACSRVIAVGDAYETLLSRLGDACADIAVGNPSEPETVVGPVIDAESQERINATISRATSELPVLFQGRAPAGGFFVPPTIFRDVPVTSSLWSDEIFGPVVCCRKAKNFAEAIELANASSYALTGGLISRSPRHIALARARFRVGNLYINRGCTGALVCRQPFGGFKMSGIGSKAGGRDYLLQFMEPLTITENTMRRGFSPES